MKKIIDKRVYDTDTAYELGSYSNGSVRSDWHYIEEKLYKTPSGRFFLYVFGGAKTNYAAHIDNNRWSSGENLLPLTVEAAMAWGEKNMQAGDWKAVFGEPESDNFERVTLSLPLLLSKKLDNTAAELKRKKSAIVAEALETWLNNNETG